MVKSNVVPFLGCMAGIAFVAVSPLVDIMYLVTICTFFRGVFVFLIDMT